MWIALITIINLTITLGGIFITVLALHGIYICFVNTEIIYGDKNPADLFLLMDVPTWLDGVVSWVTINSFESWILPAALTVTSVFVLYFRNYVSIPSNEGSVKTGHMIK